MLEYIKFHLEDIVATCIALRDYSIWNFTKVKYFPKKLMLFYEAKISVAD